MKGKLLIVDDDLVFCTMLSRHFSEEYETTAFSDPREAVRFVRDNTVDAVLTDLSMPGMDGLEVLQSVKSQSPDTDVIVMTAYAQVNSAVEAMKKGAYDYIVKPFTTEELSLQLKKLFEKRVLLEENRNLKKFIDLKYRPENIIGKSPAMKDVFRFIERVSRMDGAVLITGESGTGKQLVARAIHFSGKRKDRRLVSVHCGALPEWILESGLFGNEGVGKDLMREVGTVVLVEIGDMDLSLQAKLVAGLGNPELAAMPTGLMVIATTNKELAKLQREGSFRQDLFHRLNAFSVRVPSLRERKADIPLLAEYFFSQYNNEFERTKELSIGAVEALQNYDWPGNVREFKNLFAKICLLEDAEVIKPEHIIHRLPKPHEEVISYLDSGSSLENIEKKLITETLRRAKGNMTMASKLLNISYDTLRYRMKKFGVRQKPYKTK